MDLNLTIGNGGCGDMSDRMDFTTTPHLAGGKVGPWEVAHQWEDRVNEARNEFEEPVWSWDCNFKLDFDGPLMSVNSRFYPGHKTNEFFQNGHDGWKGWVEIRVGPNSVERREFCEESPEAIRVAVEAHIEAWQNRLMVLLDRSSG
jgi:hypothetical protein